MIKTLSSAVASATLRAPRRHHVSILQSLSTKPTLSHVCCKQKFCFCWSSFSTIPYLPIRGLAIGKISNITPTTSSNRYFSSSSSSSSSSGFRKNVMRSQAGWEGSESNDAPEEVDKLVDDRSSFESGSAEVTNRSRPMILSEFGSGFSPFLGDRDTGVNDAYDTWRVTGRDQDPDQNVLMDLARDAEDEVVRQRAMSDALQAAFRDMHNSSPSPSPSSSPNESETDFGSGSSGSVSRSSSSSRSAMMTGRAGVMDELSRGEMDSSFSSTSESGFGSGEFRREYATGSGLGSGGGEGGVEKTESGRVRTAAAAATAFSQEGHVLPAPRPAANHRRDFESVGMSTQSHSLIPSPLASPPLSPLEASSFVDAVDVAEYNAKMKQHNLRSKIINEYFEELDQVTRREK